MSIVTLNVSGLNEPIKREIKKNQKVRGLRLAEWFKKKHAPTRVTTIKNNDNTKCWRGCREIVPLMLVGIEKATATLEK